jgi:hypothetical protein
MKKATLLLAGAALLLGLLAGPASAAPPPCPPTDDACAALAARLDTVHTDLTALDSDLTASAGAPVSGTVALDTDATQRLDLLWWGVWGLVGLTLVLIFAPAWRRAFQWGTSGGAV